MIELWILRVALEWFLGWAGLSLLVGLAAGAAWWFIPAIFSKLRAIAFNVMIGAFAFNFVFSMGFKNGAASTKVQWDAAEQRQRDRGADAREQAEQEIPPVVDEPRPEPVASGSVTPIPRRKPVPVPSWMRDDKYNRDNR